MVAWLTNAVWARSVACARDDELCALCNPNRFHVGKLANPFGTKLAAVTGSFDPAEWHARIGRNHCVHEHHSALKFVRKEFLFGYIVRPDAGAETKLESFAIATASL